MIDRASYLDAIAAGLPVAGEERAAVLAELEGHLEDTVADLMAAGVAPDAAEAEAERRLGSPDRLAAELIEAHHAPRAMLAAAGGGMMAMAGRSLVAILGSAVVLWLVILAASLATSRLLSPPQLGHAAPQTDLSDFALGLILAATAAAAGRGFVETFARRAWRDEPAIGRAVGLGGAIGLLLFVTFIWAVPMSWGRIAGLLLIPVAWFLGAWPPAARRLAGAVAVLPRLAGDHARASLVIAAVALAGAVVLSSLPTPDAAPYDWQNDPQAQGWDLVAPAGPASLTDLVVAGSYLSGSVVTVGLLQLSQPLPPGWHGPRFEAWRRGPTRPGLSPQQVDLTELRPFAVVAAKQGLDCPDISGLRATGMDGDPRLRLCGTLRADRSPGVTDYLVFLTVEGPDGRRYRLADPLGPEPTQFDGTIWEWLTLPRA